MQRRADHPPATGRTRLRASPICRTAWLLTALLGTATIATTRPAQGLEPGADRAVQDVAAPDTARPPGTWRAVADDGVDSRRWLDTLRQLERPCNAAEVGSVLGGMLGGAIGARIAEDERLAGAGAGAAGGALLGAIIGATIDAEDPRCQDRAEEVPETAPPRPTPRTPHLEPAGGYRI